jgi:hypothetical protein
MAQQAKMCHHYYAARAVNSRSDSEIMDSGSRNLWRLEMGL